jgi:LPS export ABC transporter protein LptC
MLPSSGPGSSTGGGCADGLWPRASWMPALAGAALLCLLAPACARKSLPPEEKGGPKAPQQVIQGLHLRQTSEKGLLWILDAHQGVSYGSDRPTQLTGMRVRFYDGGADVRSTLTSKRGMVEDRTQTLIARDSVIVVTPKGERLETDSLRWDPKRGQIATGAPFRFLHGNDLLTGVGFQADPDLTHYTINSAVRALVRDEKQGVILEAMDGDSTGKP